MTFCHSTAALPGRDKSFKSYLFDNSNPSSNPVFQAFEQQLDFFLAKTQNAGKKGKQLSEEPECKLYVSV
jgi:hypothetical protein